MALQVWITVTLYSTSRNITWSWIAPLILYLSDSALTPPVIKVLLMVCSASVLTRIITRGIPRLPITLTMMLNAKIPPGLRRARVTCAASGFPLSSGSPDTHAHITVPRHVLLWHTRGVYRYLPRALPVVTCRYSKNLLPRLALLLR